jgi:hypothetical protein
MPFAKHMTSVAFGQAGCDDVISGDGHRHHSLDFHMAWLLSFQAFGSQAVVTPLG